MLIMVGAALLAAANATLVPTAMEAAVLVSRRACFSFKGNTQSQIPTRLDSASKHTSSLQLEATFLIINCSIWLHKAGCWVGKNLHVLSILPALPSVCI